MLLRAIQRHLLSYNTKIALPYSPYHILNGNHSLPQKWSFTISPVNGPTLYTRCKSTDSVYSSSGGFCGTKAESYSFRKYCSSDGQNKEAHGDLSGSSKDYSIDNDTFRLVFRFPFIYLIILLCRFKIYLTASTCLLTPCIVYSTLYQNLEPQFLYNFKLFFF